MMMFPEFFGHPGHWHESSGHERNQEESGPPRSLLQAFFLTSVAEKTKTKAQNSSQKLKEKTQPQGGTYLIVKIKKSLKNHLILPNFLL